jgi:hypothetical protein
MTGDFLPAVGASSRRGRLMRQGVRNDKIPLVGHIGRGIVGKT